MKNTIAILTLLASLAATGWGAFAPAKSPVIEPAPDVKLRVEKFRDYYGHKTRVTYYSDGVLKGKKQKEEKFFDNGILRNRTEYHYCGTKDNMWNVAVTAGKNSSDIQIDSNWQKEGVVVHRRFCSLQEGYIRHRFYYKKPPDIYKRNTTDIPPGLLDSAYNLDSIKYDISLSPDGKAIVISLTNVSDKSIKVNATALRDAILFFNDYTIIAQASLRNWCNIPDCCNSSTPIVRVLAPQKTIRQKIAFAELFDKEPKQKENIEKQIGHANRSWFRRHRELSIDSVSFDDLFLCPAWAKEASTYVDTIIHLGTVNEFAERNPEVFGKEEK